MNEQEELKCKAALLDFTIDRCVDVIRRINRVCFWLSCFLWTYGLEFLIFIPGSSIGILAMAMATWGMIDGIRDENWTPYKGSK